jgi:hypothetical protein
MERCKDYVIKFYRIHITGADPGGAYSVNAPPKIGKNMFFGVKS